MARLVTYLELYTQLEEATDTQNDQHISAVEKRKAINRGITETWDFLCSVGLAEKYVKSATFNSVGQQLEYPLATIIPSGEFYRIHQLYVIERQGQMRPLRRIQPGELQAFKAPTTSGIPLKLYYIPAAPNVDVTNQATWEASTFDGINGWEEHAVMTAAWHIKAKKEDAYNSFGQRKRELEQRMTLMGNVDLGEPIRVSRKRASQTDPWLLFQQNVNAYGVRGDKIELYYFEGYLP